MTVPRLCMESICGWHLFQPPRLGCSYPLLGSYCYSGDCPTRGYRSCVKWNESGFRPPLRTYRLSWARRTSWGWWDDWDDTVLQTQDSKFEPWQSEAEHATSRSRRLPTILTRSCVKSQGVSALHCIAKLNLYHSFLYGILNNVPPMEYNYNCHIYNLISPSNLIKRH